MPKKRAGRERCRRVVVRLKDDKLGRVRFVVDYGHGIRPRFTAPPLAGVARTAWHLDRALPYDADLERALPSTVHGPVNRSHRHDPAELQALAEAWRVRCSSDKDRRGSGSIRSRQGSLPSPPY